MALGRMAWNDSVTDPSVASIGTNLFFLIEDSPQPGKSSINPPPPPPPSAF